MSLSSMQINEFKQKLQEQKEKLEGVLASLKDGDPATDVTRTTDNADVGTEATESNDLVMYESLENETEQLLERTNAALERIEKGTFGVTDDGEEIPYERLQIDPTVTTIVK